MFYYLYKKTNEVVAYSSVRKKLMEKIAFRICAQRQYKIIKELLPEHSMSNYAIDVDKEWP